MTRHLLLRCAGNFPRQHPRRACLWVRFSVNSLNVGTCRGTHARMARKTFKVILIKPSHYDADGYVIQWWRSLVPSNSLASMYGLMAECAAAKALGDDGDIDIEAYDECNTVIDLKGAIRKI